MNAARVCVGALAGAFGVSGEVRLKSFCAEPAAIADYGPLWTEDGKRSFTVEITGATTNALTARLKGLRSREEAEALKGTRLYADRDALPALDEDEFYHADLIGLEVVDTGGRTLGRIKAVLNHGASDILEIAGPEFRSPVLIPFTREAVPTVDIGLGRVVVDPPEGLLEG